MQHIKICVYVSLLIVLAFFSISCAVRESNLSPTNMVGDEQLALNVLVQFLQNLHDEQYGQATQLYGGTYEHLLSYNQDIGAGDRAALLRNACTFNGFQCLQIKSVKLDKKVSETEFSFRVEFLNADGTLFTLGPCCGSDEIDLSPQSEFYFTVVKTSKDSFVVMELPPYVP